MNVSERPITGTSTGKPPACQTPRLISSTRCRKCAWQLIRSFHVFRMPITGLPSNSSVPKPDCFCRERWPNERRSSGPKYRKLRSSSGDRLECESMWSNSPLQRRHVNALAACKRCASVSEFVPQRSARHAAPVKNMIAGIGGHQACARLRIPIVCRTAEWNEPWLDGARLNPDNGGCACECGSAIGVFGATVFVVNGTLDFVRRLLPRPGKCDFSHFRLLRKEFRVFPSSLPVPITACRIPVEQWERACRVIRCQCACRSVLHEV